ncbi:MAG: hypothetical protein JW955_15330 [Sedimentisphaerales bacterium]|nr:hypothetical protein [Sedimentisphaerales bacterium]
MKSGLRLKASDTIVFIGDSITDAERYRQAYRPLGYGYVHFVGNLLWARHPELNLSIINTGVSGDTIRDMAQRWDRDCIAHRPEDRTDPGGEMVRGHGAPLPLGPCVDRAALAGRNGSVDVCEHVKKISLVDSGIARTKRNGTAQTSDFLIFSPLQVTGFSLVCRYLF